MLVAFSCLFFNKINLVKSAFMGVSKLEIQNISLPILRIHL